MTETVTLAPPDVGVEADPLLFHDEVAALVGELTGKPVQAKTITHYKSRAMRNARRGTPSPFDLPIPERADYTLRKTETRTPGVYRWPKAPRWRRSVIVAWVGRRPEMRRLADAQRARTAAGQYLPKDGQ